MTIDRGVRDKTKVFQRLQHELVSAGLGRSRHAEDDLSRWEHKITPYFEHPEVLPRAFRCGGLIYETAFLESNRETTWIAESLREMLSEYRAALRADESACSTIWGHWFPDANRAMRNVTTTAHLELDKRGLDPEVQARSCFRDIGDLLEGSLQPLARFRLDMRTAAGSRVTGSQAVRAMTFGQVIGELAGTGTSGAIYRPLSYGINVSQWRNIANHNSYSVRGTVVACTYGTPGKTRSFELSIAELFEVCRYAFKLYFVHKIAFEFFGIDNLGRLKAQALPLVDISELSLDSTLVSGLTLSGLKILEVGQKGDVFWLHLEDPYTRDKRAVKTALQEASTMYAILAGPVEVRAVVQSGKKIHLISFRTSVLTHGTPLPSDFAGDITRLDEQFRPERT